MSVAVGNRCSACNDFPYVNSRHRVVTSLDPTGSAPVSESVAEGQKPVNRPVLGGSLYQVAIILCTVAGFAAVSTNGLRAHEVFVTNEKDNTVSVIDTVTLEVVRTISVGKRPRGIIFSKDFSLFFVCASDSDAVQAFETSSGKRLYDLPSGSDPEQFALSPEGKRLYIANEDNAVTTVVDIETRQVIKQIDVGVEPEGMAVSPDSRLAITTSETTNMAHFIDTATFEVAGNILVDQRPRHAEFTPDGKTLLVSSEIGGTLSVIDVASRKIIHKISFSIAGVASTSIQPVGISVVKDGSVAYVALGPANRVAVVNMKSFEVTKYILVGQRVWHLALTPDDDFLFTTNGVSNDVTVIDVAQGKAIKSIKVGRYPWGAAVRPASTIAAAPKQPQQ